MADIDDLSQEELLCFKPAHEIYDTYCRAGRDYDLVVAVTKVIIVILVFVVIGIFLWVNTRGWDLPQKRCESDVEGQAYSDSNTEKESGHGQGRNNRLGSVEEFMEELRRLAMEGKISWETYHVVESVRMEQTQVAKKGANGGGYKEISINTAETAQRGKRSRDMET
ncbi:hypothetical protein QBC32DRAFT_374301 [Pseudoneurospora amorphoporcata]|uniref:Uncharacterized protein n=1 Tax=Pseudoneurospora amorphoporcata TaxID=241081 RepID=A0AAN6SC23_9PEZI|nr:hypothetical protein QBC32DRAFT_374301 [Pseudoneurospora amorphoporcata]